MLSKADDHLSWPSGSMHYEHLREAQLARGWNITKVDYDDGIDRFIRSRGLIRISQLSYAQGCDSFHHHSAAINWTTFPLFESSSSLASPNFAPGLSRQLHVRVSNFLGPLLIWSTSFAPDLASSSDASEASCATFWLSQSDTICMWKENDLRLAKYAEQAS
jgi:hypothetical protein